MSFLNEFKEFATKGNVVDLAVGVIIGGAFGQIVNSLVTDIIMPVIGAIIGNLDFSNLYLPLKQIPDNVPDNLAALQAAGIPIFAYGKFITVSLNFVILAFIIFIMIKQVNRLRRPVEAPQPVTPEDILLLREIRDELKAAKKE